MIKLMFSEWLDEIPLDFETNWMMILCPVGKRVLVIASEVKLCFRWHKIWTKITPSCFSKGLTTIYNKAGKSINRHVSKLPGGNNETKQGMYWILYNGQILPIKQVCDQILFTNQRWDHIGLYIQRRIESLLRSWLFVLEITSNKWNRSLFAHTFGRIPIRLLNTCRS